MCGYPAVGVAKNLLVVDGLDRFHVRRQLQVGGESQVRAGHVACVGALLGACSWLVKVLEPGVSVLDGWGKGSAMRMGCWVLVTEGRGSCWTRQQRASNLLDRSDVRVGQQGRGGYPGRGRPAARGVRMQPTHSGSSHMSHFHGAEDGHVNNAGKTKFRARRLGVWFFRLV